MMKEIRVLLTTLREDDSGNIVQVYYAADGKRYFQKHTWVGDQAVTFIVPDKEYNSIPKSVEETLAFMQSDQVDLPEDLKDPFAFGAKLNAKN